MTNAVSAAARLQPPVASVTSVRHTRPTRPPPAAIGLICNQRLSCAHTLQQLHHSCCRPCALQQQHRHRALTAPPLPPFIMLIPAADERAVLHSLLPVLHPSSELNCSHTISC